MAGISCHERRKSVARGDWRWSCSAVYAWGFAAKIVGKNKLGRRGQKCQAWSGRDYGAKVLRRENHLDVHITVDNPVTNCGYL